MPFVRRVCVICGHRTHLMTACGQDGCNGKEARPHMGVRDDIHDHCPEGCLCTTDGCQAQRLPIRTEEHVS